MRSSRRYLDQISKKFKSIKDLPAWLRQFLPIEDQVKIIRTVLGMTQEQLAKRLGFKSNVSVTKLENKEKENPTLETLKKYADALDCELLIKFIPKKEISKTLDELAEKKAVEIVNLSVANSALELQKPDKKAANAEIKKVKSELLEKRRSVLWQD